MMDTFNSNQFKQVGNKTAINNMNGNVNSNMNGNVNSNKNGNTANIIY